MMHGPTNIKLYKLVCSANVKLWFLVVYVPLRTIILY